MFTLGVSLFDFVVSTIGIGLAVARIIALPGYGFVSDLTGSYRLVLYMIIVMLIIDMVLIAVAFRGKKILVDQGHYN